MTQFTRVRHADKLVRDRFIKWEKIMLAKTKEMKIEDVKNN